MGYGPNSTAVSATPMAGDDVPSTPVGLTASADNELVELSWTSPTYSGPGTLTYHLFRDGAEIWNGNSTTYVDFMLTKGVQHSYTVAAENSIGWGPNSSAVLATPFGVPDEPWGLTVVVGDGRSSLHLERGELLRARTVAVPSVPGWDGDMVRSRYII